MKLKWIAVSAALIGLFGPGAFASDFVNNRSGALGLGVGLGQPLGVTGKIWMSNMMAVDGMMGYHIDDNFDIHSDFLLHAYPFGKIQNGELPLYIGLGGRVLAGDDTQFGFRIPVGLSYLYTPGKLEFFAELAPVIAFTDGVKGSVDGLIGLRIYAF